MSLEVVQKWQNSGVLNNKLRRVSLLPRVCHFPNSQIALGGWTGVPKHLPSEMRSGNFVSNPSFSKFSNTASIPDLESAKHLVSNCATPPLPQTPAPNPSPKPLPLFLLLLIVSSRRRQAFQSGQGYPRKPPDTDSPCAMSGGVRH